ncbi:ATP-dependent 6-phosphofructokinase [Megasphaera paucivorans]|uniref:ATP-dependent 6-phosphofructokinase n=1 Tax=Megasphaera paucivorans TaxID=349095 RepID=A0A1G9R1P8_9FIRM|nr:ATP-dependent 6-phosphofructokinase [Megasphaera paucivorans]SDM17216.1 6-phosphofructokinase [Megasphaera paucivorans]
MIHKIGVLTSGGDSPGMNAVIRGVTRYALYKGIAVEGILRGYEGLLREESIPLDRRSVGEIIHRGGTMLKTARSEEFKQVSAQHRGIQYLRSKGVDGLVVIGGDGSMKGAECLGKLGMPTITIPGTIDNDMAGTEYTIGFDTAVNTVLDAVNRIRDTAFSHDRVAIVEVMGRQAGFIALHAGIACGAEIVLVPEKNITLPEIKKRLVASHQQGKTSSIIIVAEGAMTGEEVYQYIKENTANMNPSLTVLGYIQRGGAPTARDVMMASVFSEKAIDSLIHGVENAIIGLVHCEVVATPYEAAQQYKFAINNDMYNLVHALGQ